MKKLRLEFKWAFFFIVLIFVWQLIEKYIGLHDEGINDLDKYQYLFAIPAFIIYFLALYDIKKNAYKGKMTFIQGFLAGVIITAFVVIFTPLIVYISTSIISPNYLQNALQNALQNELHPEADAEEYYSLKGYIIISMLSTAAWGIATSAIVSLVYWIVDILKKK